MYWILHQQIFLQGGKKNASRTVEHFSKQAAVENLPYLGGRPFNLALKYF
jgi:hypothetical protein